MRRLVFWVVVVAACGNSSNPADDPVDAPSIDSTITTGGAYDQDGPTSYTVETHQLDAGASPFNVTVYMPSTPGPHPVVSISAGTSQTAAAYAPHAKRLASYGIAAIIADDPGVLTNTSDVLPNSIYVVETYLPSLGAAVDLTKVGLSGHSRGGAVSLLTAQHLSGKIKAWFGLDPVDNEFGQAPREYARTKMSTMTIPTAFIGGSVVGNCAPAADSYQLLYPRAPSPSVLIVGIGAGHTQFESQDACTACSICTPNGTADSAVVLAYTIRYMTAFFGRELNGDTTVGAAFQGAGASEDIAAMRVTIMSK
jgi:predicted dienelactone hydrolase